MNCWNCDSVNAPFETLDKEHICFRCTKQVISNLNAGQVRQMYYADEMNEWAKNLANRTKVDSKQLEVIYCLKDSHGYYKVGRSKNWATRRKKYATENSEPLKEIFVIPVKDYVVVEKLAHNYIGDKRKDKNKREWFVLSEEEVVKLETYVRRYEI